MSLIECKVPLIIKIVLSYHWFLGSANKVMCENVIIKVESLRLFTTENCAWKPGKSVTTNYGS